MTVLVTARNTARNGEDRFLTPVPPLLNRALISSSARSIWAGLVVSQLPTAFILWYLAHNAGVEAEQYILFGTGTSNIWCFFFFGTFAAFLFWYLVSLFYYWTYRPSLSNPNLKPAALVFPHTLFGDIADAAPTKNHCQAVSSLLKLPSSSNKIKMLPISSRLGVYHGIQVLAGVPLGVYLHIPKSIPQKDAVLTMELTDTAIRRSKPSRNPTSWLTERASTCSLSPLAASCGAGNIVTRPKRG
jgi:hypothetical protein